MSLQFSPAHLRLLRLAARASSLVACAIFTSLAIAQGPPVSPEGPGIEVAVQYVLVVVGILATLRAWFAPQSGGWLLIVTGVFLGIAAAGRYSSETSFFVALIFVLPGVLFLLVAMSGRRLALQVLYGVAVLAVMAYGGVKATARHDYAFGPAHPQSTLTALPVDRVEWLWSGAVSTSGFGVKARLAGGGTTARLVVSESESLLAPTYSQVALADEGGVVALRIEGLQPGRKYYYAVEVDGSLDSQRHGSLRTFPAGRADFSILVGACARTRSNGAVFDAMRQEDALLYLITGDAHYENITRDSLNRFREAYGTLLTSPAQSALYRQTPIAYVWDDHDFGGSNSTATSPARRAARLAYRENVPHYELPAGSGDAAIYQAFSVGDVRFLLLDTRSMRNAEKMPGGGNSLLGAEQRDWLKAELLAASRDHSLVVLVSGVPWIAPAGSSRDDWGGFAEEREDIANYIATNGIANLLFLAGDAHMLAIDDGSNTDYSTSGGATFPVMQAGALDRPGSVKGGPYSEGTYPGPGQYGLVSFRESGGRLSVELSGRNWLGEEIVAYRFEVPRHPALP